jgi:hypothetical protein
MADRDWLQQGRLWEYLKQRKKKIPGKRATRDLEWQVKLAISIAEN